MFQPTDRKNKARQEIQQIYGEKEGRIKESHVVTQVSNMPRYHSLVSHSHVAINKLVGIDWSTTINIKSLSDYLISGKKLVKWYWIRLRKDYYLFLFCNYLPQITHEYF